MKLSEGQFIELDYTGKLADGKVFDTTNKEVAEKAKLNPKAQYRPTIICLGEGQILNGIDEYLIGKELGKHTIELTAEKAFGKKDRKLLKLIPTKKFTDASVKPVVGLEVNVDNHYGVIRSVSGGRVTVDFNHPLASKDLIYEVDVKRLVEKTEEQVAALLDRAGFHHHGVTMEGATHAVINVHQMPPQPVAEVFNKMINTLTKVETVSYHLDEKEHH